MSINTSSMRKPSGKRALRKTITPYLLLAPVLLFIICFMFWPIMNVFSINHNEDGLTVTQARVKFTMLNAPIEDYTRVMGSWSQEQLASQQAWLKGSDDWCLPDKLSPSSDESREISATMADIETFVKEETVKMILGTSNYTFEAFCEQIRSMGVEDVIASYQTILDRYNAR